MRTRSTWWLIFSAAALVVVAALVWVTVAVMELEKRELAARADARQQESLRLALWRMDSWLSPRLAREAARPYFEYLPYYPQQRAYTSLLNEIQPGEVLTPSPLLTLLSEYFPIHFQLNADRTLTSPQVPTGNLRDLAEATAVSGEQIDASQMKLSALAPLLHHDALAARLGAAEEHLALISCAAAETETRSVVDLLDDAGQQAQEADGQVAMESAPPPGMPQQQQTLSKREYQQRAMSSNTAQQADVPQVFVPSPQVAGAAGAESKAATKESAAGIGVRLDDAGAADLQVDVGPLVAMWIDGGFPRKRSVSSSPIALGNQPETTGGSSDTASLSEAASINGAASTLIFVRRVSVGDDVRFQGFLADWPALRTAMLGQIVDLFGTASLEPVNAEAVASDPSARILATVPAELITPDVVVSQSAALTPARLTLALTWLAVIGAIAAAGVTLHHSIAYAAKRSRFTSAVTHELRTPLTTFRMYSEMLAENMVRDEGQRKTYLQTLKSESARLAMLVENVLAYARLEEGRSPKHAQPMSVRDLMERVKPMLERRAAEAGMTLDVVGERNPQISQIAQMKERELGAGHGGPPSSSPISRGDNTEATGGSSDTASGRVPVLVDADAVGQILFNLVDNACKYASGPEVAPRTIDIDAAVAQSRLRVTVRDHGPGIPAEYARTIFKPFDRGRHGPSDTTPGVGLGLALARGLARDLGGDLTLERPTSGRGAAFVVSLPV